MDAQSFEDLLNRCFEYNFTHFFGRGGEIYQTEVINVLRKQPELVDVLLVVALPWMKTINDWTLLNDAVHVTIANPLLNSGKDYNFIKGLLQNNKDWARFAFDFVSRHWPPPASMVKKGIPIFDYLGVTITTQGRISTGKIVTKPVMVEKRRFVFFRTMVPTGKLKSEVETIVGAGQVFRSKEDILEQLGRLL